MGKLKDTSRSFIKLLTSQPALPASENMQVVIVCGKNEALRLVLEKEVAKAQAAAGRDLSGESLSLASARKTELNPKS